MSNNHVRYLTAGVLLLAASLAHADAVYTGAATAAFSSPATGITIDNHRGTTSTPTTYTAAETGAMATSISDSANGGSVGSTAIGSGGGTDGTIGQASASTQLAYRVTLVPLPGAPLDALIGIHAVGDGSMLVTNTGGLATANFSASGYLTIQPSGGAGLIEGYDYADTTKPLGSFVVDTFFSLFPGQFFDVALLTIATANGSSYAQAFVDPVFTIDAAFSALYELVGIPAADIVPPPPAPPAPPGPPTSSVPEPSTWLLLAIGVAALASFDRKRVAGVIRDVGLFTSPGGATKALVP